MRKRILSIFLSLCIVSSVLYNIPINVHAEESGNCGDNATWLLDDNGTLIISGSGEIYDWDSFGDAPWYYDWDDDYIERVIINEGITSIGSFSFVNCHALKSIQLPNSLKSINYGAFALCENLESVTIPDNVTDIQGETFGHCTKLKRVKIGNGVKSIGRLAFYTCESLEEITIPQSVTSIDSGAFERCYNLTEATIYSTVVGYSMFEYCNSLVNVYIGNGVENIEDRAFIFCDTLASINLGDGVKNIGEHALNCNSLSNITVNSNNKNYSSVGGNLYNKDKTELVKYAEGKKATYFEIPSYVSKIGNYAFYGCANLRDVKIPSTIQNIGDGAFYSSGITTVIIPNSVKSIGTDAFCSCKSLTDVIIGKGITQISDWAFGWCDNLINITIPISVKRIGKSSFRDCDKLTNVYYEGSKQDWNNIYINTGSMSYNSDLTNATIHFNYTGDTDDYVTDDSIDEYIIGEVKKYTSSGEYAQFDAIMSSNASYEEKFRRLNELFANEGLTDLKEGIEYLSESTSYRSAYRYLTTNEIYCAFNYFNWLNTTKDGLAARSALYASGLIFNFEVFSYMDLSTYTENDYPGVKKNKALLKEIMSNDSNNTLCDIFDYSNKTAKFLKNIVSLNKITMDNEMDAIMDKIINCTSKEESQKLQKEFVEKIIAITGTTNSINMFSDNFADALDSASDILSFAGATVEDIVALSNLDADIEIYKKNSKFLYTIYSNPDVSFEMRLAAYQLYDEIENGYYNKVVSMLNNVIDFSLGKMYTDKSMLRTFLESQGISESGSGLFADALGTIKLATYITNIIIDTGEFVKQVAYTQGYAELATLYSLKLEEDKQAFLANETAENAWKFFEDYTMLWKLRYNGEQQYLDMSKVKMFIGISVPTCKYDEKEDVVKDTMEHLNECKFRLAEGIEIPSSVQYEKKSVVKCPVDVYVYNSDGTLIATLKDGQESDITNEYGRFAVVKESYSGEYAKVICQSTTEDLTIKMIAVDDGLVDFHSLTTASTDVKSMDKLMVGTGNSINVNNDSYSVDTNSDGNADINGTLIIKDTNSYVAIESLAASEDNITLITGQTKAIGVTITPANATNTALEWISLDKSVATVQNGLIKATGSGTTTIIVRACDSNEIEGEIVVTVLDKIEYEILSHICNENSLEGKIKVKSNVDSKMITTMYVAIYGSDGTFKDVSLTPIELDAKGETVKDVNIEIYVYTTDDYIKVFIWDENLTPFCKTEKTLLVPIK